MTTIMTGAELDPDEHARLYRAAASRDARFDGVFFVAVRTTGIYCRPSCPAVTPKSSNVTFHRTAASAHESGYRACRRCRPDTTPGSPEWDVRADAAGRAMRLIRDGVVERDGVDGLADTLGYSTRHLNRMLTAELGAGPLALARSQRAATARTLIETTSMTFADVAFAAGFASVRQFNDTIRQVYAASPSQLRASRRTFSGGGQLSLRLPVRQPFDSRRVLDFLAARAVPGVEAVRGDTYARVLRLHHGTSVVSLRVRDDSVTMAPAMHDLRDLAAAVQRCRQLLDLDADALAIDDVLGADESLAPLVRSAPGLRVPGHVDGFEVAVRAILGQQVSVAGARTTAAKLAERFGDAIESDAATGLVRAFPAAATIAAADPADLGVPRQRGRALVGLAAAVASGQLALDPGADREETRERLLAVPGIGPWTAAYIAMRALSDPDVFLDADLVVRKAMRSIGADASQVERWAPWRSYAVLHLWRQESENGASR
ncbi:DNA-3-methyladenine glycosylase 2 family protein [Solicola gregarius]|uniref:DNA-3-methyladenine glycosylase II n=1 Tax=Solicola gregarius TaxID=2908642 RepID=A0AA46YLL5_9ACTN|nr:AlkA N-terminal domain-containing protein [Solicola gregarius]UYM05714.1 helix-turn-helix domain-containing protein [Solicola gregarius]